MAVNTALRSSRSEMIFDSRSDLVDNSVMEIQRHVQNGVVVFDNGLKLPEGAAVTVTLSTAPVIHVSSIRERVQLPLVKSDQSGMLELTNDRIAEILEAEDVDALKAQWNAPS